MNAAPFRLPAALTIDTVGETRHALSVWIDAQGRKATLWRLDGAGVGEADAAGVQLLLDTSRSASLAGVRLRLESPSPALCLATKQFGIAPIVLGTLDQPRAA